MMNENAVTRHELEKYEVGEVELAALADDVLPLLELDITERQAYKQLASGLQRVVKIRTSIEARRKELKKPVLELGKAIDVEGKRLGAIVHKIEAPLAAKKNTFDAAIEQERQRVYDIIDGLTAIPVSILNENLSDLHIRLKKLEAFDLEEANLGNMEDKVVNLITVAHNAITAAIAQAEKEVQEKIDREQEAVEQAATAKRLQEKEDDLKRREAKIKADEEKARTMTEPEPVSELSDTMNIKNTANVIPGEASPDDFIEFVKNYLIRQTEDPSLYVKITEAFQEDKKMNPPKSWRR